MTVFNLDLPIVFECSTNRFLYFKAVSAKTFELFHKLHNGMNFVLGPELWCLESNFFGPCWH